MDLGGRTPGTMYLMGPGPGPPAGIGALLGVIARPTAIVNIWLETKLFDRWQHRCGLSRPALQQLDLRDVSVNLFAADLWSLSHGAGGDSDYSAHHSSLVTSSVTSAARSQVNNTHDSLVGSVAAALHESSARLQRLHSSANDANNDDDDEQQDCYRVLADHVTAGAYQIKHRTDRPTVLSR